MHRTILAAVTGIMAAFPIGNAWGNAHASTLTRAAAAQATTTSRKYKGPSEDMRWGPVQVTITVKGKRLTNVRASVPTERMRSQIINEQAVPILRSEALKAQGSSIDEVSGATLTSDAYMTSLHGALKKAHLKKT